jgi:hypothetical protein
VRFAKRPRKDDLTREYLRRAERDDRGLVPAQVLYVGVAQEKQKVFRTVKRRNPVTGAAYTWLVRSTAIVNQYYFCCVDEEFGPSRSRTSWAGPTSRSAPIPRSAATRPWSTARSASAGPPGSPITRCTITQHRSRSPAAERGGPRTAGPVPAPSWPRALRAVRAWLSPCTVLQRWWQAWSKAPPPPQRQALINSVAAGCGLHLYIPN